MMTNPSGFERALRFFGLGLARMIYRVSIFGRERLPEGGFLLLPNHITWVDAIVLSLACSRPIRFIIDEGVYRNRFLNPFFHAIGCIPITARKAKNAMREAIARIRAGEIVCLFPEGELSRTGSLLRLRRGYEIIARESEAPVVPVYLDQLWDSIFSFQGGRFFTKWPRAIPLRVTVAFGEPLSGDEADIATLREQLLKIGEFCYSQRPNFRGHVGRACLRGLKRHPFRTAIIDGMDGTKLARGKLLGVSIALARHLRKAHPEKRIGVVLPPGKGGLVANLAVIFAGKIPVNLNFTSLREAVASAEEQAGLQTIITARAMAKRLEDFPWTTNVIHLDEALPPMKKNILVWWIGTIVLPRALLARILKLPRVGDHAEAFLRAYLRKAEPAQLRSLRYLVTGAEKLPLELAEAVEARFGKHVYEGYGLTETSPVVSVNLPELEPTHPGQNVQPSNRPGSTGKMLAGIAAEIRHPETDAKLSLHETGMLWLRGPNIFEGYLDAPEQNAAVLKDGWFKTGDIGRFDEDGFLFIEGRLSRFSKIGGEMVPHETIEQKIIAALNIEQGERFVTVMGIPDSAKGEALVLLSSIEIDQPKLRAALAAAGIPNLWIPRMIRRVEAIPVLASGKLDLVKCKR